MLEARGFATATALGVDGLYGALTDADVDLVVICSSFSLSQRTLVNKMVAERFPGIPALTLLRGGEYVEGLAGETLPMVAGPAGMIEAAERLTAGVQ